MAHVFSVIGLNHGHISGQVKGLLDTRKWRLKHVFAEEDDLRREFVKRFPNVTVAESVDQVLADREVELIASASINAHRGPLAEQSLRAGKHFFVDKPCVTTLDQLEAIKKAVDETGNKWFAFFGEMLTHVGVKWVRQELEKGNLGEPVHFMGLGPHTLRIGGRPGWMFDRTLHGGILNDIASHQIAQFCYWMMQDPVPQFSRVGNLHHPGKPEFEDFGDASFTGSKGATGYIRADWFTPEGLPAFGDIRQQLLTTEAYVEHRKIIDIGDPAGSKGGKLIVTRMDRGPEVIDLSGVPMTFFDDLTDDVENGTETAIPFELGYKASKAIIEMQRDAVRLEPLSR
jgi:predicted dehydrogenase